MENTIDMCYWFHLVITSKVVDLLGAVLRTSLGPPSTTDMQWLCTIFRTMKLFKFFRFTVSTSSTLHGDPKASPVVGAALGTLELL